MLKLFKEILLWKYLDCNLGNSFHVLPLKKEGIFLYKSKNREEVCILLVNHYYYFITGGLILCQNRRRKVMMVICLEGNDLSFWYCNQSAVNKTSNINTLLFVCSLQVKIWFQNHRYKCKRQAKEKAMAEQNQHNQVCLEYYCFTNFNKIDQN